MPREETTINGRQVILIQNAANATWKSNKPIPCSVCRKYHRLMFRFCFADGELTICFSKSRPCWEEFRQRFEFMAEECVEARSIVCPDNTPETRKRERREMSYKLRWQILKRDDFKCVKCGGSDRLEVDHITPICQGGKTEESNLQTLCYPCNHGKGGNG